MSRRDLTLKAVAGALQAKSLDLTKFARARSASLERQMSVRSEDAAGALAFSAQDIEVKGETVRGDPLPALLLRLKYADQKSKTAFHQAHLILMRRHGWNTHKHTSETMFAVAYAAIVEWVQDPCPKCRGAREGVSRPQPCPECRPPKVGENGVAGRRVSEPYIDPWGKSYPDRDGRPITRTWVTTSPRAGCPKCNGLGRIFRAERESRGMRCATCGNSGRRKFSVKQRWAIVNDYLAARGSVTPSLGLDGFRSYWLPKLHKFLDILHVVDRNIAAGLDLGLHPAHSRGTDPEPLDFLQDSAEDEPEAAGPRTGQNQPTGELPSKF